MLTTYATTVGITFVLLIITQIRLYGNMYFQDFVIIVVLSLIFPVGWYGAYVEYNHYKKYGRYDNGRY